MRVSQAAVDFYTAKRAEGRSVETIRSYRKSVDRFISWLNDPEVEEINVLRLRQYIAYLQETTMLPVTVAKNIRELKVFVGFLCSEIPPYLIDNPFPSVKVPTFKKMLAKPMSQETFDSLLAACDSRRHYGRRDAAVLALLWDTGMRVGELCSLKRGSVSLTDGRARVLGKGTRERTVFFSPPTAKYLSRYRIRLEGRSNPEDFFVTDEGLPMKPNTVTQILRRVAWKAGVVEKVNPHSLRHAFGRNWLVNGGDYRSLQKLMGHSSITTTEAYTNLADDDLAKMHSEYSPMSAKRRRVP